MLDIYTKGIAYKSHVLSVLPNKSLVLFILLSVIPV